MTSIARFALSVAALAALGTAVRAEAPTQKEIDEAVRKGVAALKKAGAGGGVGPVGLNGLAMLEAGVPADDPAVKAVTDAVRDAAFTETGTYQISICLLYLDRRGDPSDRPLIQLLGVRLLAGQTADGGWSYTCVAPVPAATEKELRSRFDLNQLATKPLPKPQPKPEPKPADPDLPDSFTRPPVAVVAKPPAAAQLPVAGKLDATVDKYMRGLMTNATGPKHGGGDNSNTQFGVIATWVARRHGVPVEGALARIEKRFLDSQTATGGWPYAGGIGEGSPSMTCAGLLGLSVGVARKEERLLKAEGPRKPAAPKEPKEEDPDTANDPFFHPPKVAEEERKPPPPKPAQNALEKAVERGMARLGESLGGRGRGKVPRAIGARDLYFWWSLERVGVVYGKDKIGDVEWYPLGAEALVNTQQADGSWGAGNSGANTAFAILFLSRSNLVRDLSAKVQRDPAAAEMRTGPLPLLQPKPDPAKPPVAVKPDAKPGADPKPDPDPTVVTKPDSRPVSGSGRPTLPPVPVIAVPTAAEASTRLAADLLAGRDGVLVKLRDGKGGEYTAALSQAIGKLEGDPKKLARDALADRLTRMTAATLRDMLADKDAELRRAAALAVGMKEELALVPALIDRLDDPADLVARAARASLKSLAGTDFGPPPGATAAERRDSAAAWRAWWAEQQKRKK